MSSQTALRTLLAHFHKLKNLNETLICLTSSEQTHFRISLNISMRQKKLISISSSLGTIRVFLFFSEVICHQSKHLLRLSVIHF